MKVWLVVTTMKDSQNITAHATRGDALIERDAIRMEDTYDDEFIEVIERPVLISTETGVEEFNG